MGTNIISDALNMSQLIEGVAEGLCVCNRVDDYPYVRFTIWNKKMFEITGYTMEEINQRGLHNTFDVNPKDHAKVIAWIERMYKGEHMSDEEWEIVKKDEGKRILSVSTSVVKDDRGVIHVLALVRDITKQRQLEIELKEIEERYSRLFELSPDAVFVHGDGNIMFANSAGANLLGANKPEELIGLPVMQFIHCDYHDLVLDRLQQIKRGKKFTSLVEEKIIKLDGQVIDAEVISASMPYYGKDHCLVFVRDITDRKIMENSLKESEALLRQVTENTMDMITLTDINGAIKYATPSHKAILGYDEEELIGKSPLLIVHPEDLPHIIEKFNRFLVDYNKNVLECRCRHKEGHYLWIEVAGKPVYDESGRVEGIILSSRDITNRVNAENALRKSENKFRELFNNINDAIFMHRLALQGTNNCFIEVNDVACRKLGYSREELYSMNSSMINPALDEKMALKIRNELLEKGSETHVTIIETKQGKHIPVEINSRIFDYDGDKVVLSIARDITERIKNEKSLKESEERYRSLVELLPYGIYIRNKNGMIFANKTGLEYLDVSSIDEIKNKMFEDLLAPHPDFVENCNIIMEALVKNGHLPLSEEKFIRLKDNRVMDMETAATRFPYEGEDSFLIVSRDISERKQAEELRRSMEEKNRLLNEVFEYEKLRTEFFANISHELRTPINVILSTLQLVNLKMNSLVVPKDVENLKKHIGVMKQNCYRLIRLINNLIDVTKIDSGYFQLNLSNHNIINIVEDITMSVVEYIEDKGISLIFDTNVEDRVLACDPDKIERIILNLISNAVKFTEPGGNITVNMIDEGENITISVRDTGVGIPEEKQKYIFERFVQVDKSLTRAREGSGIGLSLVKSLVEMHNGNISVRSEFGKGSEFIIQFPVTIIEDTKCEINKKDYNIQGNIEKINVEFSDIYF